MRDSEKVHQVAIMGTIFTIAARTILWLGKSTRHSQDWRDLFRSTVLGSVTGGSRYTKYGRSTEEILSKEWAKAVKLDEYWFRAWVVQEVWLIIDVEALC